MVNEVSDYVAECFKNGVTDYEGVCAKAKERIKEIDPELAKIDVLRAEKIKLTNVLRELHDDSVKRNRNAPSAPNIELDDSNLEAQKLRYEICKLIEETGAILNSDLIQKVGGYSGHQRVIRAVKFLGEKGILARDDERRHIPGPNWNERPIYEPSEA